jgi:hypothetical protein
MENHADEANREMEAKRGIASTNELLKEATALLKEILETLQKHCQEASDG